MVNGRFSDFARTITKVAAPVRNTGSDQNPVIGLDPTSPAGSLLYGPSGELILTTTPTGATTGPGVGRYTRAAGPEQDAHLRSGAHGNSAAYVEAGQQVYLCSNAYADGAGTWQRFDTSKMSLLVTLLSFDRMLHIYKAEAGGGPISWTEVGQCFADTTGRLQVRAPASDAMLVGALQAYLGANAYYDGSAWQRYNTGLAGTVLVVRQAEGVINARGFAAGANPVGFTKSYDIDATNWALAANPPRGLYTGGTTSVANNAWTMVVGTTVAYNNAGAPGGTAPLSGGYFWPQQTGIFHFQLWGTFAVNVGGVVGLRTSVTSPNNYADAPIPAMTGFFGYANVSADIACAAGMWVQPLVYQNSGAPANFVLQGFSGRYVSPS